MSVTTAARVLGGVPLDRVLPALRALEPGARACWAYDLDALVARATRFQSAFAAMSPLVAFALKANALPAILETLHEAGILIGLISNTHRCLASFQSHFELDGLISAAVSSSEHGYMKPHRSIFEAGLKLVGIEDPVDAVMVGDSLLHDIEGARRAGMRAVLVSRSGLVDPPADDVPVITTLADLPARLEL